MSSLLSNATQRAIRNIVGPDNLEILIETVADQDYVLSLNIPVGYKVLELTSELGAGTCTLNVQQVTPLGVATSIAGLSAVAATTARLVSSPTFNGSEIVAQGNGIKVVVTGNAGGANMNLTLKCQRFTDAPHAFLSGVRFVVVLDHARPTAV